MNESKTLIILGMHRSGTSLITQWLHKCGLHIGEDILGSGIGNLDGHFEDMEFVRLHEEIFNTNHLPSSGLTVEHVAYISIYQREKIKCVVSVKNSLFKQWGWKDPRTCLFLDVYQEIVPKAYYLVIIRDYHSVVSSLLQRSFAEIEKKYLKRSFFSRLVWKIFRRSFRLKTFYHKHAEEYLKVWIKYNECILKYMKRLPHGRYSVVNYSMILKNENDVFNLLKDDWGFRLKHYKFGDVFKEKLLSEVIDIEPLIFNKDLLKIADNFQDQLQQYVNNF